MLVDSTSLKLCGGGEWLLEKHYTKTRRSWRQLHIGMDSETGQIVAAALTTNDVDDGSRIGPPLENAKAPVASFTGGGAYDQKGAAATLDGRDPDALVTVPPRFVATPSEATKRANTAG
ncbi:transposase [Dankookia rubra]|uniref:transposase n=1 Tax=Dankookia rubra TaxID=1442381 RepID=UPI0019D5DE14|nr:transposase [Dankookia rubra]